MYKLMAVSISYSTSDKQNYDIYGNVLGIFNTQCFHHFVPQRALIKKFLNYKTIFLKWIKMNNSQIPHILIFIKYLDGNPVIENKWLNFESTTAAQGTLQTVSADRLLLWHFVFPHKWNHQWPVFWVRMVSRQQQHHKYRNVRGQVKKSCWVHRTDSMASGMAAEALVWCVTSGEVSSSAWTLATASTRTSASSPSCCCCCSRFFFISCWLMWWRIPAPRASPSTFTTVVVRSLYAKWTWETADSRDRATFSKHW